MSHLEPQTLTDFRRFAEHLADHARSVSLRYFRSRLDVESKHDDSPVTIADRETEKTLRDLIGQRYPSHTVWGEEYGYGDVGAEFTWLIDPIDGTQSFIRGFPTFGTLIGLLHHGEPIVGVIDMPALDERWSGVKGEATVFNDRPCVVSGQRNLSDTTVFATSPGMFRGNDQLALTEVTSAARGTRFGYDCYAYAMLAGGFVDAVMEASLHAHDYLPIVPIVTGAGGIMCDWTGKTLSAESGSQVLACASQPLAASLQDIVAKYAIRNAVR